jgi:hypothetical protein
MTPIAEINGDNLLRNPSKPGKIALARLFENYKLIYI